MVNDEVRIGTLRKLPYKNTVAMLVPLENFCEAFLQSPSGCRDVGDWPPLIALINGKPLRLLKGASIIGEVKGVLIFCPNLHAEAFHRKRSLRIRIVVQIPTSSYDVLVSALRTQVINPVE